MSALYAKLSHKENFSHKFSLKEATGLITIIIWYVNNMERSFFPTEIETRGLFARSGLVNKHHYDSQLKLLDSLNDLRWKANIEAKHGRFKFDRYRPFAFQYGNLVCNPGEPNWIPNAIDNAWENCPGQSPIHEYHVIHTY